MSRKKNHHRIKQVIGNLWHDEISLVLDTGFMNFKTSEGLEGLAKIEGREITFNAIYTNRPGKGSFTRMLQQLKRHADAIHIIHIVNEDFKSFLLRNGFTEQMIDVQADDGEPVEGVTWIKKSKSIENKFFMGADFGSQPSFSCETLTKDGKIISTQRISTPSNS